MLRYRLLEPGELERIGEIDRTEAIETIYLQHGAALEPVSGDFSATRWTEGEGEHSVARQVEGCEFYVAAGGTALGAFDGNRLVGIGIVVPHVRERIAQLAYLHVSNGYRGRGIGRRLNDALEKIARDAGDAAIVVSSTPSVGAVAFYRGRGYEPTATPLPEIYDREPEDVHMEKRLRK